MGVGTIKESSDNDNYTQPCNHGDDPNGDSSTSRHSFFYPPFVSIQLSSPTSGEMISIEINSNRSVLVKEITGEQYTQDKNE